MARKMMVMDWRAMKYYHVRVILLPALVIFIGLMVSPLLVMPTCALFSVFFSLNPFAVEEKGELNTLYLSLPVSRSAIVSGRFMLAGAMGLCGVLCSVPIMAVVNSIGSSHYYVPLHWYVFILAISYLSFSLFVTLTYPLFFKLGYCKGKFWGLILPAAITGAVYGVGTAWIRLHGGGEVILKLLAYASEHMFLVSGGITVFATVMLVISVMLSQRLYAKRSF